MKIISEIKSAQEWKGSNKIFEHYFHNNIFYCIYKNFILSPSLELRFVFLFVSFSQSILRGKYSNFLPI
jgi:hypothetical protein